MATIRVLGPVDVCIDGIARDINPAKERLLLAILASRVGARVPMYQLVEDLWPDRERMPTNVEANVQVLVARLRRRLAPHGGALVTRSGGYSLELDTLALDAATFLGMCRDATALADAGQVDSAVTMLRESLGLWRGRAYDGVASAATDTDGARLEEARISATGRLFDLELLNGNHHGVMSDIEAAIASAPFHERFWAAKIVALYRCGRQADALKTYRALREITLDELGTEPTPALRRLEHAVLQQHASLDWAPGTGIDVDVPAPRRSLRIVVADDDLIVREGISAVLTQLGHEVVGGAGDVAGVLDAVKASAPDVAVVDIRMPPLWATEGLDAAARIRAEHPATAVVVLSQYLAVGYVQRLLQESPLGVAYVLKADVNRIERISDALDSVVEGRFYVDPAVIRRVRRRIDAATAVRDLTPGDRETLAMVAEGLSDRAIALRNGTNEQAVSSQISAIFDALEIRDGSDGDRRVRATLAFMEAPGFGELIHRGE